MPVDFDPAWEYWEPDPEIAQVMYCCQSRGSLLDDLWSDTRNDGYILGMRFGRGNPNKGGFHLARPRSRKELACQTCGDLFVPRNPDHIYCSQECKRVECEQCGELFAPRSKHSRFCTLSCARKCMPFYHRGNPNAKGRPRYLLDVTCANCCKVFRPVAAIVKYCSLSCASRDKARRGVYLKLRLDVDVDEFSKMWMSGASRKDIQEHFGISEPSVKRLRKRFNLPSRASGNHSRSKQ